MKGIINSLVLTFGLATGIAITSCNSPSKKMEKAREDVQEDQRDLNESKAELQEQKVATEEEWNVFKKEQEVKIKENELRIAELRAKIAKPGTGHKSDSTSHNKIVNLEQRNNLLKEKIKAYESNHTDWKSFKREYNHDVDELGNAVKDLTIDNKD